MLLVPLIMSQATSDRVQIWWRWRAQAAWLQRRVQRPGNKDVLEKLIRRGEESAERAVAVAGRRRRRWEGAAGIGVRKTKDRREDECKPMDREEEDGKGKTGKGGTQSSQLYLHCTVSWGYCLP